MRATVIQKKDRSFTVLTLANAAPQLRSELRGEGIKADETTSVQEGKDCIAFSFGPKTAIEEIERLLEIVGYQFTTQQIA